MSGSRKRISLSCERLRALLPRFDGRREDMASILEMSVQFLQMAGTVLPRGEQQAVSVRAPVSPRRLRPLPPTCTTGAALIPAPLLGARARHHTSCGSGTVAPPVVPALP